MELQWSTLFRMKVVESSDTEDLEVLKLKWASWIKQDTLEASILPTV